MYIAANHDSEQHLLNNYQIHNAGIWVFKSSAFFTFGLIFTMGVLFLQFMPNNRILKVLHLLAFSLGFLAFEFIVMDYGLLEHIHFSFLLSLSDNVLVMATIAWVKDIVLTFQSSIRRKTKRC